MGFLGAGFVFIRRNSMKSRSWTWRKFLCVIFFVIFASHLVLLRDYATPGGSGLNLNRSLAVNNGSSVQNKISLKKSYPKFTWRKIIAEEPRNFLNATKVLLLSSNPRSGSSFTGELISAMPNVSYFFEPLWFFGGAQNKTIKEKMEFVATLLDCRFNGLRKLLSQTKSRTFIFRKPSIIPDTNMRTLGISEKREVMTAAEHKCLETPIRIAKFFRLRLADILPLMSNRNTVLGQRIKVILLLRDPRAIINSIMKAPHEWKNFAQNPRMACSNIYNDMTAYNSILGSDLDDRILVVKYEDLIKKPKDLVQDLYKFIESEDLVQHAFDYLNEHISDKPQSKSSYDERKGLEELRSGNLNINTIQNLDEAKQALFDKVTNNGATNDLDDYFTTFRNKSFRHDHWRTEMSKQQISWIEDFPDCQSAIEMLNYN